ncbi:TcaA NTF2-like domain-containing protein [Salisediminibacterium beveridgei]|nr:hypothetical protein [Salisediminibacterium beveridgei]
MILFIAASAMVLISACNDDENDWSIVDDDEKSSELVEFLVDYKEQWENSLQAGTFSTVEPYFVSNSQVYHMERRQHQQISGRREVEQFLSYEDLSIQANSHGEYRITWKESVEISGTDEDRKINRTRSYTINERSDGSYRIISVEREDD